MITAQSSSQRKAEETAVLYNYELTGIPRDDSEESKRQFVMWCTKEAGIPKHEVTSIEYVDIRRSYGIQTAVIKFGNKGNRAKMSRQGLQRLRKVVRRTRIQMPTRVSQRQSPV